MSRELTRNERRLAALGAMGLLWGAILLTIGFTLPFVVVVVGGLLLVATVGLQGRAIAAAFKPRARLAGERLRGATASASKRVGRIDWAGRRDAVGRRATAARTLAASSSRRALAAGGSAVASVESRGLELRRELGAKRAAPPAASGRREAMRLNEQAAVLRSEERLGDAIELSEQALAIFRTLGDSHGAGRVLANLGALHRGQGHDAQARAAWNEALERFEPGTPEYDRMARQLRLAS